MTLHLVLKSKWYDMIASGEKKEEYRAITPYWTKRIWDKDPRVSDVIFHRGYTSETICFAVDGITQEEGMEEWGADPGVTYYVIKLGERLPF